MIVADTSTIVYLYLPTAQTDDVVSLLHKDPHWVAPLLWRSEFRNVLALYVRKGVINLSTAIAMQSQAEQQLAENEYSVNSTVVLTLTSESGCSAYGFPCHNQDPCHQSDLIAMSCLLRTETRFGA